MPLLQILPYPALQATRRISKITSRTLVSSQKEEKAVLRILKEIEKNGNEALLRYIREFDAPKMSLKNLLVTTAEREKAHKEVSLTFKKALRQATAQIKAFHMLQKRTSFYVNARKGVSLGQVIRPVEKAGIYVPGGSAGQTPLVSSVLMGAIPAKVAGVSNVVMASPSRKDGTLDPHLIVAADLAGVDAIYKMGSAWAIGALAFGTSSVPQVDVVVGPGNIYVALAKKWVAGRVGIDMIAGPSEILIVADKTANPIYIAADMLGQAEHDAMAASILITDDQNIAKQVVIELERQMTTVARKEIVQRSLKAYGTILLVSSMAKAMEIVNQIAPEHLELMTKNPQKELKQVKNAGAVFLGNYTPEVIGDYIAGPNHILPTAGTARFSSALSVDHFLKKMNVLSYDKAALQKEVATVVEIARTEGMEAHARSALIRLKN